MDWTVIVSGIVGAAAPEIVRLYKLKDQLPQVHRGYVVISIIFFILGGFTAWIFQAASTYAGFYIGASTDALISSIAGKPPTVTPPTPPAVPGEKKLFGVHFPSPLTPREYLGALTGSSGPSKRE